VADGARPAGCRVEPRATAAPPASSDPREQEATAGRRRMGKVGVSRGARRRGKSGSRDAGWGLGSVGRRNRGRKTMRLLPAWVTVDVFPLRLGPDLG